MNSRKKRGGGSETKTEEAEVLRTAGGNYSRERERERERERNRERGEREMKRKF